MKKHMALEVPEEFIQDLENFKSYLDEHLMPHLSKWYREGAIPRSFFQDMGNNNMWPRFDLKGHQFFYNPP